MAKKSLDQNWPVGLKVKEVRPMTQEELAAECWYRGTAVVVFEDGNKMYASSDDEGNAAGTLFGVDSSGTSVGLH